MRDIKFRVWIKIQYDHAKYEVNYIMLYPHLEKDWYVLDCATQTIMLGDGGTISHYPMYIQQLWATINDVEYFEGDIISFGSSLVCVIIYNEVNKCFSFIEKSEYNRLQFCDELSKLNILANLGYAKVEFVSALLGNIFENPELIKN